MTIKLYTSDRIENLVDQLALLICEEKPSSPFNPIEILISSAGIKRFVNFSLAKKLKVAANINYSNIHTFFWRLVYELREDKKTPFRHRYAPEILQWQILKIFQSNNMPKSVKKALDNYLKSHQTAQYDLAQIISQLFNQYMIYRPEWIIKWDNNQLVGDLGKDEEWQKDLWYTIRQLSSDKNRVELLHYLLKKLQESPPKSFRLPERVFIFCVGALAPMYLHLLDKLSKHCHIYLLVSSPCCEYWGDSQKNNSDGNPLLSSLGGQGRDFFNDLYDNDKFRFDDEIENFDTTELSNSLSLLQLVQYGIRHFQPLKEIIQKIGTVQADDSIVLHSAYSPIRELYAVKDAILYFLQENPQYSTDDVAVLSPNIEAYAPYIEAVFGQNAVDNIPLPFSLADTAISTGKPYLQAWSLLLQVFDSRMEIDYVLSLLDNECILQKAGLTRADLPLIDAVFHQLNTRFAWDSAERQQYGGVENEDLFSWIQALNRIMAGLMLPENVDYCHHIAPLHLDINLLPTLKSLILLIETVQYHRQLWQTAASVDEWTERLRRIHSDLLDDNSVDSAEFLSQIDHWQSECGEAQLDTPINATTVVMHIQKWLVRPNEVNFLKGGISFGSLVPLRSLPFAFLALLGMDASTFPRPNVARPFDLMQVKPQKGDRSRRDDDRYLFLETIISARKVLYLSYVGKDIHDDSKLAPSELIWELGDTLTTLTQSEKEYWEEHTISHPLQPFSAKYFHSGSLKLSFRQKYKNALNNNHIIQNEDNIQYVENHSLNWLDFLQFWKNPARYYLQQHIAWQEPYYQKKYNKNESFIVENQNATEILEQYYHQKSNIDEYLIAKNYFPTAYLGKNAQKQYQQYAEQLRKKIDTLGKTEDFNLELCSLNFSGSLNNVDLSNHCRIILDGTNYSEIHIGILIKYWLEHLIANIAFAQIDTIIFCPNKKDKKIIKLESIEKNQAQQYIKQWIKYYQKGQQEPTYFFPKSMKKIIKETKEEQQIEELINHLKNNIIIDETSLKLTKKIIDNAHKEWFSNNNDHKGESETISYQILFNENHLKNKMLLSNYPISPINTSYFIQMLELMLPLKKYL